MGSCVSVHKSSQEPASVMKVGLSFGSKTDNNLIIPPSPVKEKPVANGDFAFISQSPYTFKDFDKPAMSNLLMYLSIFVVKKKPFSIPEHISIPIVRMISSVSMGILGTGFCTIFLNLGQRQPGDVSAYSIFNEDFRELPRTLNADAIDRDIRTGQF
ncbi:hypothetical protein PVK06_035394 [Gossypium arboreum]|uniref:SAYSvFN domain-containing protein n=1 Tax=Gossypium arboreum TaxID=29729 RepID=A0ABR0NGQ4_GOSAR|nr:hypothetical protein PVK06_035394 [Gossypium arboreum]